MKTNVARLLHAFIPFSLMVLIQRGLLLMFGYMRLPSSLSELLAFIPAALCCAVVFSLIKINPDDDDGVESIPPLKKKGRACSFLQTAVAIGVMTAMMYAVSSIIDETLTDEVALSFFTVISTIVIHPIIEEYVFRGLIYGEMRRMNPVFATLAQAVMFAIVHNTVNGMLYALVAGMVLAVLVEVSGRLSTAIMAHMLINVRSLMYMTLLSGKVQIIRTIDTMIFVFAAISLIGVAVIRGFSDGSDDGDVSPDSAEVEVVDDEG